MVELIARLERSEFRDWTAADLDTILRGHGYAMVGSQGRCRCYRNEMDPKLYTFRDGGTGPIDPDSVRTLATRLQRIGKLRGNDDNVHA